MAKTQDPARDRLARLLRAARGRRAVIVAQDRPDPDGMATAAALTRILREKAGAEALIAASGESGRAENVTTLQFLGESLHDLDSLELEEFDFRALVDTQPGFGNNSWPEEEPLDFILDHHPRGPGLQPRQFADIRPQYGSASTIATEYLRAAGIEPEPQLATVLLYGIKTDTQDLSRGATAADNEAFLYLYARANRQLLAKIERERLPREYFVTLAIALCRCRIYASVAICALGEVDSPDVLSEMADLFLRLEGARWVLCYGLYDGQLHLSARTLVRQGNAGQVMADLLEGLGEGGGHDMMAGGQAALPEDDDLAGFTREIELRFLRLLDVKTRTPEPLVPARVLPGAQASDGEGTDSPEAPGEPAARVSGRR
ncbi:MAG: DHH family phosphoesterase [Planctomycetota bacterium]